MSALDVVGEFTGFRPSGSDPSSPNKANQMFEFGLVVRIPPARGMQLYGMLTNEDKRDSIKRFFVDGSSYLAGVRLPALGARGALGLCAEYTRTCALCFRHSLYRDGSTLNRKLIGTDLGPDAHGIHTEVTYDVSDELGFGLTLDWDYRGSDLKAAEVEPDGSQGDIITVQSRPAEERYRAVLDTRIRLSKMTTLWGALGYERVHNQHYVQGDDVNNFKAAISLSIDLDKHFKYLGN